GSIFFAGIIIGRSSLAQPIRHPKPCREQGSKPGRPAIVEPPPLGQLRKGARAPTARDQLREIAGQVRRQCHALSTVAHRVENSFYPAQSRKPIEADPEPAAPRMRHGRPHERWKDGDELAAEELRTLP